MRRILTTTVLAVGIAVLGIPTAAADELQWRPENWVTGPFDSSAWTTSKYLVISPFGTSTPIECAQHLPTPVCRQFDPAGVPHGLNVVDVPWPGQPISIEHFYTWNRSVLVFAP